MNAVRVKIRMCRYDSRPASSFEDLRAGKNINAASDLAPTLDGALMNIACVRMYMADIFSFKASSDAAQDLAGGARQTLPRLVSAYFLALQPSTDADARGELVVVHVWEDDQWMRKVGFFTQLYLCLKNALLRNSDGSGSPSSSIAATF